MLKLFALILFISLAIGQVQPIQIELLKRFTVTIDQPNFFKYYYVDIDPRLIPEEEALIVQPDGQNNGIHYYTQLDRLPTHDDHDVSEYLFNQRFVLRQNTNVKRLYFGFYRRNNGTSSNNVVVFKGKTRSPILKDGETTVIDVKKGFIGTFGVNRPVSHQYRFTLETSDPESAEMYSVRSNFFIPNELWRSQVHKVNRGVNTFNFNETAVHYGIYAKSDLKIIIKYAHYLSYIDSFDYVGRRNKNLEHFALRRKTSKQTIAIISKGVESKLYLNHGDDVVLLPNENNYQLLGKPIYGLSGYWGSYVEVNNLGLNIRIGVDKGKADERIFIMQEFDKLEWGTNYGSYFPHLLTLKPGEPRSFQIRSTDFGPFEFKFEISLQKKSKVKVTQIKNGVSSELINTDRDFELDIQMERRDNHVWIFEGDNTILFRGSDRL